ncbi:uncharacterized protein LOC143260913 [Megalopta genalis]|uniref:uncharacterized protein LOC143260913 n=1 Tax=Megalopta genalis TaxID=115081 RepID=UPI003FD4E473
MSINGISCNTRSDLSLKVNVVLEAEFVLRNEVSYVKDVVPTLLTSIEEFQERGSGWALSKILHLMVNSNKYQPLQAGCQVSVPRTVQLKKAVLNVYSDDDNACFYWAVVASLYPAKNNLNRTSSYPHYSDVLHTEGFQLPMLFKDIPKFEKANDVSVNVFEWGGEQERCQTLHLTSRKREKHEFISSGFISDQHAAQQAYLRSPVFDRTVPMASLTAAQISTFRTATYCHVCEEPLGAYRCPAHSRCNLSYQSSYVIPVVFHNLSGYDAHFSTKELANAFEGEIDALPLTKEKYISFTKHSKWNKDVIKKSWKKCIKFRFIDSFKFLNSSLDKLSSYLDKSDLRIVRSQFNCLSNDDFHLLTRKGVFPYDYVSIYDKLSDTCLPPREAFYNQLCDSEISDVDYCHANEVWSRFAHYYTLPGFAWDAMLKLTKIELELFTDVDMLLFV